MGKKLRIRDRLLLGLAIMGDLYFEAFEPYGVQVKKMKGFLPPDYRITNFANTVSRMLKTQQVEKIVKDGQPYLRLSSSGKKRMIRDFSFLRFAKKPWDGYWRVVFYDIPEAERKVRKNLRKKLKELGFGELQQSTYVSPFDLAEDLREFIFSWGLEDSVFVSVSKRLYAGDGKALAEKVWNLTALNRGYLEWLSSLREAKDNNQLKRCYGTFLELLKDDPCLPRELLPRGWLGEKANEEAKWILTRIIKTSP